MYKSKDPSRIISRINYPYHFGMVRKQFGWPESNLLYGTPEKFLRRQSFERAENSVLSFYRRGAAEEYENNISNNLVGVCTMKNEVWRKLNWWVWRTRKPKISNEEKHFKQKTIQLLNKNFSRKTKSDPWQSDHNWLFWFWSFDSDPHFARACVCVCSLSV